MADMLNGSGFKCTKPVVAIVMENDLASGNDNTDLIISKGNYLTSPHVNVERMARYWGCLHNNDVNAATVMLALKHGPKIFPRTFRTGKNTCV